MIFILVLLLAINYTFFGFTEGLVWSKEADEAFTWNEHVPLTVQRIFLGILILTCGLFGFQTSWQALASSLPMFFFFHDGMIYLTRNSIRDNVYKKRWFDESTTSSAKSSSMSANWRIILFIIGVLSTIYFQFLWA